jgi:hypothetical protein
MPIFEMRCAAHGPYESTDKKCPHGCPDRFQVQEIRTPPAYHNGRTAYTDATLRGLADSCGLTDMKNDKDGSSVMSQQTRPQNKDGLDFSPRWVDIPHAAPGWSRREGERSPVVMPEQVGQPGLQAANIVKQFQDANVIGTTAEDFRGRGPSIAASKAANQLFGVAKREELE